MQDFQVTTSTDNIIVSWCVHFVKSLLCEDFLYLLLSIPFLLLQSKQMIKFASVSP